MLIVDALVFPFLALYVLVSATLWLFTPRKPAAAAPRR